MIVNIITLFPEFFSSPLSSGLMGKAIEKGLITVNLVDLRSFSTDRHHRCDDYPFGGGAGMVMVPDPIFRAVESIGNQGTMLFPSPSGIPFTQDMARELAGNEALTFLCGHYEGVDQRVIDTLVDREVSLGDFVLSGGEYAVLPMLDAIARLREGFMSNGESLVEESFEGNLLEYPHYTRPESYRGIGVPAVLVSGDHGAIEKWRMDRRIEKTKGIRPDLYKRFLEGKLRGDK